MRRRGHLALAIAACLALGGCGGAKQAYKYRIAVIPKGLTHEFWQSIHRGAERAAADLQLQGLAVEVLWDGPTKENDTLAQISIIERNIPRVNGIVLAPQHSQNMVAPVQQAVAKGVPVVIIDSGLQDQSLIVKYIATNNYHGGELAAEHLLKVLRDEGKPAPRLVLFRYQPGSESTDQREQGFLDYVNKVIEQQKQKGDPPIVWASTDKYAGATKDSALREATPLLNNLREKGVDGVFCPNESSSSGMVEALRSLNLNKKVRLVGFDSSEPLLQALTEGDLDGLIVQDPYRMGYLGVWTMVQHLEGYNVTPDGDKNQSTGENVVTREDLNRPATRQLFDADMQSLRKMEVPTYPKR
jgi:ribose transport system substrate-binding protein